LLTGHWSRPSPHRSHGFGEPHELSFLKGLAQAFSNSSCASLPTSSPSKKLRSYPVPDFLQKSGYESTVNIAVTGNSGVGKSLFINTVRGVRHADPTWAPVGVGDTTRDPVWYDLPKEPRVRLWDLAGALASSEAPARREPWDRSSIDSYIRTVGLRYFDVVLLLSSGRLTETEIEVSRELKFREVPFFFVRTKLDWDIENSHEDYGMTEEEVMQDIREDLIANDMPEPYLLNARSIEEFDFPRLIRDVLLVVAARWPNLLEQSLADLAGESAEPDPTQTHCSKQMARNDGQEGVESLARYNGRWYWVEDPSFMDFLRAQSGAAVARVAQMLCSREEQTFRIHEDGRWEHAVTNAATSYQPAVFMVNPINQGSEIENDFFGRAFVGTATEYIHDGSKLVSEWSGHMKDSRSVPVHFRMFREVVRDRYWLTWQDVIKDISGRRVFARWPLYVLANETGETVVLSTYSGWALVYPSMTREVPPGRHSVDASGSGVRAERAVFKLGSRVLKVPELRAWETFVLRAEDFA